MTTNELPQETLLVEMCATGLGGYCIYSIFPRLRLPPDVLMCLGLFWLVQRTYAKWHEKPVD